MAMHASTSKSLSACRMVTKLDAGIFNRKRYNGELLPVIMISTET
jgi:hypothetical protein